MGLTLNDHDKYIANKIINGKQCTIVFYVNDNKISHTDPKVVTLVIEDISKYFGELTVSRGKKHDYLGMDVEIKDQMVYIGIKNQLTEALEWSGKQEGHLPATPTLANLFEQHEDEEPLSPLLRMHMYIIWSYRS